MHFSSYFFQESFDNLKRWFNEVDRYATSGVKKLIVGNKADLEDKRAVSYEQAKVFIFSIKNSFNLFFSCSQKKWKFHYLKFPSEAAKTSMR